ncbi:methyltransferase, FxLD system [Catellatospora bangladeshensis]|nr:methyltransferase, FxLD system [Catellatospora bangladeshensis]
MVDADRAAEMRDVLIAELRTQGKITSDAVEAAIRQVPRERFMPEGTDLAEVYGYDNSVVTKRDEHGRAMSSVSAAYIQAVMLEQAQLRPGMSVLEVGSGGLNAAYIAEIVGPQGRVVSIDIDPEVIDRAATALDASGYGSRVRVLTVDAEHGVPDEDAFDAIIVTVGAWDIAPAWLRQLRPDGVIVVPLIMNNVTRVIGFRRDGDRLVSTATEIAGFVPMQGDGGHADRVFELPDANGHKVRLAFDSGAPDDMHQLDGALATERAEVWSGVTIPNGVSFVDLHLWFAWYLDGFCRFTAEPGTVLAGEKQWFPFGVVSGGGFAYLVVRPALEGTGAEFGARGYGDGGELAATAMVEQIQAWDRYGRRTEPTFAYWPSGGQTQAPTGTDAMAKTHGVVTISWPKDSGSPQR